MHTELAPAPGSTTIELAVKIWRYDAESGEKELKRYEVEAPDWVTLLDVLDIIKHLQDAHVRHREVRARARHLTDGKPAGAQGPRRRHEPVLGQDPRDEALARPGVRRGCGEGAVRLPAGDERHPQGSALHHVRLLRLGVQFDG